MKMTYCENSEINHYEIRLTAHPKNKKLVTILMKQFQDSLEIIEVYDEYKNIYPMTLLEIYYFEMVDHRLFAYTENDVYMVCYKSIASLHERVSSYGFYRINVRTLVNVKHVRSYHIKVGSRRKIILDNGDLLVSTRRFKPEFDKMIGDFEYLE